MPGRWRKIEWNGFGSNPTGLHTKKDFLERAHHHYYDRIYYRLRGDREIPHGRIKKNDLEAWMAALGAHWA